MSHISVENHGVRAEFKLKDKQKPYIEFLDPSYARASAILLNIESKTIHVSLHEGIFLIGEASNDFFDAVLAVEEVELCAELPVGDNISLHVPIGVYEGSVVDNVVAMTENSFPAFSAGGFAITALA